jgi:DNA mismatch repair protein MutS2
VGAGFEAGDPVQTPLGKGVVREVRNGRRLLIEVSGRSLEFKERDVSPLAAPPRPASPSPAKPVAGTSQPAHPVMAEIDLHGLTVDQALARVEEALNDAILADMAQVRFIHGRSGGRLRAALHKRLKEIPSVQHFLTDPRNEGVTIVEL